MKFIIKHQNLILLLGITAMGGFLRFWNLGGMPVSLNWDEVSHGYNAYSILKTGMDEWGVKFPLIFRAFGDYKLPVYIYLSTIPIWLFGLSALAVRFISALAGSLAIPGIYLLTKQIFQSHLPKKTNFVIPGLTRNPESNLPLVSAFLLAISPWHFFISRPALEANLSLTFIVFGFYYLLKFLKDKSLVIPAEAGINKNSSLLPSSVLLGLSLHTYNTARVFVPILLFTTVFIYRSNIKSVIARSFATWQSSISLITSSLFFSACVFLVVFQIFSGEATARYNKLQILSESAVFQIGEKRSNSKLPDPLPRLIHNRPVYFVKTFTKNYLNYFSPQFFFQSKGSQSQFAIPQANLLTLPVFILSIAGFLICLWKIKQKDTQFLYAWLFLSPVAAALTIDPPQALRPNPMIPALIIFATLALSKLPKILQYLSLALAIIYFSAYLQNYYGEYKTNYSQSWQYGNGQIVDFVRFYKNDFTNVFITKRLGEPHMFYAFYSQLNPKSIQPGTNNIRFQKSEWYWTDKIENVYFVNDWDIPVTSVNSLKLESGEFIPTKNSILITSPDHVPINASIVETIKFLDGTPAFIITSVP